MKTIQVITILFLASFTCCINSSQESVYKAQEVKFILDSNELRIITDDSCDKKIVLDSFDYISKYDSIKRNYFFKRRNLKKSICICFNFQSDINSRSNKLCIPLIPRSYGVVATTIPPRSFLMVSILDSNSISHIVGNELFYNGHETTDSLNNYVKRLFLNKPDTSRYGQKFVSFLFPNDSLYFVDRYLTQLVIGYIKAQRELCRLKFSKDLTEASAQEIKELKTIAPLIFRILGNNPPFSMGFATIIQT